MEKQHVTVIAEAGVNHNGSLAEALRLVEAAAEAGADIVKFQTFDPSEIAGVNAPTADYQRISTGGEESQRALLESLVLTPAEWVAVRDHCLAHHIEFLSTGFDRNSLDYMLALGIKRIKVPSGELTNRRLLEYIGSQGLPVVISTGMANFVEVEDALRVVTRQGLPLGLITLLHCTSAYPAPFDDLNLRALLALRENFGVEVGYSDHSLGPEAVIAAVALGAVVVEKHLTLDRSKQGPDHAASMEPIPFGEMVRMIRHVERSLGDGVKRCMPSEQTIRAVARRSLVATRDIPNGTLITEEMVTATRPGGGISPMALEDILNRPAQRSFRAGEMLS